MGSFEDDNEPSGIMKSRTFRLRGQIKAQKN